MQTFKDQRLKDVRDCHLIIKADFLLGRMYIHIHRCFLGRDHQDTERILMLHQIAHIAFFHRLGKQGTLDISAVDIKILQTAVAARHIGITDKTTDF